MFKMKSVLCIVAIFSLALVSCTERIPEKAMPDVDNGVITMVKATVAPLQLKGATGVGNFLWNETHNIGIYGSTVGENECYLPVKSTIGDNEAYFFGNIVGGDMSIYMPYVSSGSTAALDGRVVVPVEQKYYADPFDHLMYNSTFLVEGKSEEVTFDYHAGLVKIQLQYDIQDIVSVSVFVGNITAGADYNDYCAGDLSIYTDVETLLVNGSDHVTISGFPEGTDTTIANPLTLWAAMAPGSYENFVVEISTADMTISTPVKGEFVVEKKSITEHTCVAKEVKYDNGVGDFEGENGDFNPVN